MNKAPAPPGLGLLLRHLLDLLDGDLERVYAASGLDYRPRYTPVMRALIDLGPSPIRDIARHASITHSAASQTVAQMTRKGLLKHQPGADARERVVRLTPKARRMLPKLQTQWAATRAAAENLNAELPCSLSEVLTAAIRALERQSFRDRIARSAVRPSARNPSPRAKARS